MEIRSAIMEDRPVQVRRHVLFMQCSSPVRQQGPDIVFCCSCWCGLDAQSQVLRVKLSILSMC